MKWNPRMSLGYAIRRGKIFFRPDPRPSATKTPHLELHAVDSKSLLKANYFEGIVLLQAEAEYCWCVFHPILDSPFVQACRSLASSKNKRGGHSQDAARQFLLNYYEDWRRASLAEIMRIPAHLLQSNRKLASWELSSPAEASVSPWNSSSLTARYLFSKRRKNALLPENRVEGDLIAYERVVQSIKSNGYQPHDGPDGDIIVEALISGSDYRFVILNGIHRAAALVALGNEQFRVRCKGVVSREYSHMWPKVQNGTFSEEAALAFFDQHFIRPLGPFQ